MTDSSTRAVLFDLDGTLINTVELIMESYRYTMQEHGLAPLADEVWLKNLGIPLRAQFRHYTEDPDEIQAMISTYTDHNLRHHDDLTTEYPGVCATVRALHAAGYRLAVVTSKMHGALERGLTLGGFDGLFEVLIGADDVEHPKPHPEPVLRALEQLDVHPQATIFVGDSPYDMESGRAARVRTAAALWGPFGRQMLEPYEPDYWLEDSRDIERLLSLSDKKRS